MAFQTPGIFSLLFLISVSILLFILSWAYLSENLSWTALSGGHSDDDWLFDDNVTLWYKRGNWTLVPDVVIKKIHESLGIKSVTKLKPDQVKTTIHGPPPVPETPMPPLSKKDFEKLPQWDFEDVYNQDAPPRQTTCAQSLRNSQDESFKKAFLPNICLFLHKDNMNMSEWNRLSHFNNPFGFMEYKYNDVMASVKLIPKPKEPLLPPKPGSGGCVRCAVVGNGGILNGSKMGKEIDSHDYIFRMNGAAITGYEEDVGSRTSVYVHTAHAITTSLYVFRKYGYKSAPHDEVLKFKQQWFNNVTVYTLHTYTFICPPLPFGRI
uniref:alpha-N-acetylgalactosaminide alpha-2,6-sialyltransferase n=1 Tax=Lates calcarifer TaxID=8187 RepID=A0A4W6DSP1_LATCA